MATAATMTRQRDTSHTYQYITLYYLVFRKINEFLRRQSRKEETCATTKWHTHQTDKMESFQTKVRKKPHKIEIKRFTKLPIFISRLRNEYRVSVAYVGWCFMWPEIDGRIGLHAYENDFLKNHMTPKTIPVIIRYFLYFMFDWTLVFHVAATR